MFVCPLERQKRDFYGDLHVGSFELNIDYTFRSVSITLRGNKPELSSAHP